VADRFRLEQTWSGRSHELLLPLTHPLNAIHYTHESTHYTMRETPQKWLWRPAAVRVGGVSPPGCSLQVDSFPPHPYSRS